jgi:hypothetical protein
LIKLLFHEIDFQGNRQKEASKLNLLKSNLTKIMKNQNYLDYTFTFLPVISNLTDNVNDIMKLTKLKISEQLIFALGVFNFLKQVQPEESEGLKILK